MDGMRFLTESLLCLWNTILGDGDRPQVLVPGRVARSEPVANVVAYESHVQQQVFQWGHTQLSRPP